MHANMATLVVVPLLVWIGVSAYLFMIDQKLSKLEAVRVEDDL